MRKVQNLEEDGFEEDNFSARSPHVSNLSSLRYRTQNKGNNPKTMLYIIVALLIFNFIVYFYWESKHAALLASPALPADPPNSNLQAQLLSTRGKLQTLESQVKQLENNLRIVSQSKGTVLPTPTPPSGTISPPGNAVNIPSSGTGSLPLNLLFVNSKGQRVEEALYPDEKVRKQRAEFKAQRVTFINSKSNYPSLFLAKHNLILDQNELKLAQGDFDIDWKRLEDKIQLSKVTTELPMCVIAPGYNNNANFRIEHNLNSIFTQNYTNYKAVIVNDASTDGSGDIYRRYFEFYGIPASKFTYIENTKRVTALENLYIATHQHCSRDSIVVTLDADDEFIGRNVLKVFNWGYTTKKSGVLYSNFYWYQQPSTIMYGFTSEYTDQEKSQNIYRNIPMKFSHLRSYRTVLFLQIAEADFKDDQGKFFSIAYDMAMFLPLMELACARVNKVDGEFHYLYNIGTGLNDYNDRGRQVAVDNKIRAQKKYDCYKPFDEDMKKLP